MAKRMKLTELADSVLMEYHDPLFGLDRWEEFWVPSSGGYVRRITCEREGTMGYQVCERLGSSGATLTATPDNLAAVIRREYRRMRARAGREG